MARKVGMTPKAETKSAEKPVSVSAEKPNKATVKAKPTVKV